MNRFISVFADRTAFNGTGGFTGFAPQAEPGIGN
jgi:hypothetical protein